MNVNMDKSSALSSWECAQRLYEKIIELENKRRKSAQARVPSDPTAWQQIRENYEAIILEDHTFAEHHNIEYALWQLHYKRIEELRAHFNASLASASSNPPKGVKGAMQPDRLTKIRLQFKTFLSEATGFYHDLIMKIRAKYGLPLSYFSEGYENQIITEKDGKKSADMRKGLISCHRCLIYLGDLARYKGLYGEGDSKNREYAAASSFYSQAAALLPTNGNPHHQLAILASYSGDELVAFYRYFRSLAVETPFTTARDNLIVSFEKNRQSYSQLLGDVKALGVKKSPLRINGKDWGKIDGKPSQKNSVEANLKKERTSSTSDTCKVFFTRFIRLNGILFTRTSLETFPDVLSLVSNGFLELLSSGPEEEFNFGTDATDNGLALVRMTAILIFSVHNVNKESEGQTYAEILQHADLFQNACTAAFELMGRVMERCGQLRDPSSSFLLPGILVFMEWLACGPDVAVGKDVDENQEAVRSKFWSCCIAFLNKIASVEKLCLDAGKEDDCFHNMSRYEEGETENCLALWEDFELRGFLPLLPAHMILDFSRKHYSGGSRDEESKSRLKRILAAGKALANVVKVDKKMVYLDSNLNKFMIGVEHQNSNDFVLPSNPGMPSRKRMVLEDAAEKSLGIVPPNLPQYIDEEDEVIVFKPLMAEKRTDALGSEGMIYGSLESSEKADCDLMDHGNPTSVPLNNIHKQAAFCASANIPISVASIMPQPVQQIQAHVSKWLEEEAIVDSVKSIRLSENGHLKPEQQGVRGISNFSALLVPIQQSFGNNYVDMSCSLSKVPEAVVPSKIDVVASSAVISDNVVVNTSSSLQAGLRKAPVSRPARHLGPPPGFSRGPSKQVSEPSGLDLMSGNPILDDYSWLDGYELLSTKGLGNSCSSNLHLVNDSNCLAETVSFPFPGKQVPPMPVKIEKQNGWKDHHVYDYLKAQCDPHLLQQPPLNPGNQQFCPLPEQYPGQSIWAGHHFV